MSINSTLFFFFFLFGILCIFTVKVVWPPIVKALDERAKKVADSLAAADQAKAEVQDMNAKVEEQLAAMRSEAATQRADAERRAQEIVDEAKTKANEEAARIIAAARAEAQQEAVKVRDSLRAEVSALAVKGAEQILRKEINASVHADLLERLQAEL